MPRSSKHNQTTLKVNSSRPLKHQLSDISLEPNPYSNTNPAIPQDPVITLLPPTDKEEKPSLDAEVVVPSSELTAYSDIYSVDNSFGQSHKGMCMFADIYGIMTVKPENLIPGQKYFSNDRYN